ncbi:MAG: efflux RND transporter permease subunit, partial [Desulfobacterales bacterium]
VIIMMAIPFGLIGAILGHLVMGLEFTIVSIFGIVALSGIVVNDSLILIDFINRALRDGVDINQAVVESGKARFRPVLLTSVTTVAGLFPLLLERSFQAQFLIPMAVSICFGLMAATILTLLYVPALYLILQDITNLFARRNRLVEDRGLTTAVRGEKEDFRFQVSGLGRDAAASSAQAGVSVSDDSGQRTDDSGQKTDDRRQITDVRRRKKRRSY